MRILWRTQNGPAPAYTPVIPGGPGGGGATPNVTQPYWRYGTNTTPETFLDGQDLRYMNERDYGVDLAALTGFECIDFDRSWAFRDSVDEGSATEIRFGYSISSGVSLNAPLCEYSQDVILAGAAA
jgi:hypothetical protein